MKKLCQQLRIGVVTSANPTGILLGILKYAQSHTTWNVHLQLERYDEGPYGKLRADTYSGLITDGFAAKANAAVLSNGMPFVLLLCRDNGIDLGGLEKRAVAHVDCDNIGIAKIAAEHLVEHGYRHLAAIGSIVPTIWAQMRTKAFVAAAAKLGIECNTYEPSEQWGPNVNDSERMRNWLMMLPKPVGIFVSHDVRARHVLEICREIGIAVPGEVGILGVDDDGMICETSRPTLSSIPRNDEECGYRAAAALDEVLSTGRRRKTPLQIMLTGNSVIERQSTRYMLSSDPLVVRCREIMESPEGLAIEIPKLVQSLNVSRRLLEMRFKKATGRTLNAEITSLRIAHAKRLLASTNLSQEDIAIRSGFCSASHMHTIFRRHCNAVPSRFRAGGKFD